MSSVLEELKTNVFKTGDSQKISYFIDNGNIECILRNSYRTRMCNSVLNNTFNHSNVNVNSKVTYMDENGTSQEKRLCKNPMCRYAHNYESMRNTTLCLDYIFGVCKNTTTHDNKIHGTIDELPSYCFYIVKIPEGTFFFYHNMIRTYNRKTRKTYVISYSPIQFRLTSSFTHENRKNICNTLVEKLKTFEWTQDLHTETISFEAISFNMLL